MKQIIRSFILIFITLAHLGAGSPDIDGPQNPKITVYPNPATDYISFDNVDNIGQVAIVNLVGRKLKMFENIQRGERYDVSDLPGGMYLVQIMDQNGKVVSTVRVSKR